MHQSHIARILSNPVYCGQPYSKLLKKTLTAPQIVSVETYTIVREKCSQKAIKRVKRGSHNHALRGKVFCPQCNHVLSKKGESWGCHCYKTNIQEKFLDEALAMVLSQINTDSIVTDGKEEIALTIEDVKSNIVSIRRLMGIDKRKLDEAKNKLEVLRSVYSDDKLVSERNEVTKYEKRIERYNKELVHTKLQLMKSKAQIVSIETNSVNLIDKVIVSVVDRANKKLEFYLMDGTRYVVTVRTRKNEYTIKKRET